MLRTGTLYLLARLIPSALTLLNNALLTHVLSITGFGRYGLGLSAMAISGAVCFDWLTVSYGRFSQPEEAPLQAAVTLIFAALCLVSLLAGAAAAAITDDGRLIWLCVFGTWAVAWFELMARRLIMALQPLAYLAMNSCRGLLILASSWSVAWYTGSPLLAIVANCLASLVSVMLAQRYLRWRPAPWRADRASLRLLLVFGWPIALTMLLNGMVANLARPLLAALSDHDQVAFFTAAQLLIQNPLSLVAAGIGAATTALALHEAGLGDIVLNRQLERNLLLLSAIMLPAAGAMVSVMPDLLPLLLPARYAAPVAAVTPILVATVLVATLRGHYFDVAFQLGRATRRLILVTLASAVTIAVAAVPLILRFGMVGSSLALLAAESAALVASVSLGRRVLRLPVPGAELARLTGAVLVMVATRQMLSRPHQGVAAFLAATGLIAGAYICGLLLFNPGCLRERSLAILRRRLQRLRT